MEVLCLQEAKLIEAKARNNMYFIEYTVKKPAQEQKHLLSAVALGFNGRSVADNLPCPFWNSMSICVLHCCMSRRLCIHNIESSTLLAFATCCRQYLACTKLAFKASLQGVL